MFTEKQLSFLESEYFQTIRITDDYVEFRSRRTWHCFIIKKEVINVQYPFTIYHKHKLNDLYHRHWQSYSVERCVASILDHEAYVLRIDKQLNKIKGINRRKTY